jgi:hypothetical protein
MAAEICPTGTSFSWRMRSRGRKPERHSQRSILARTGSRSRHAGISDLLDAPAAAR